MIVAQSVMLEPIIDIPPQRCFARPACKGVEKVYAVIQKDADRLFELMSLIALYLPGIAAWCLPPMIA